MKRICLVLLLILLSVICFAETQRASFEIGMSFPYSIENTDTYYEIIKSTITTVAINLNSVAFYTERTGYGVYLDLIFPVIITVSAGNESVSAKRSDYDLLFGMDILCGPAFLLVKNEKFSLPFAFGPHTFLLSSKANNTTVNGLLFGFGTNLAGEFHFNKTIFLYTRFQVTYDIITFSSTKIKVRNEEQKYSKSYNSSNIILNPAIGVGFKY